MESVLPERFSLSRATSLLIGFIEWSLPLRLGSTDLIGGKKHWTNKRDLPTGAMDLGTARPF